MASSKNKTMPNLTNPFYKELTDDQKESFNTLKNSDAWEIVSSLIADKIEKDCNADDVLEDLEANQFKTEILVKRNTRQAIIDIFGSVEGMVEKFKKDKINFG